MLTYGLRYIAQQIATAIATLANLPSENAQGFRQRKPCSFLAAQKENSMEEAEDTADVVTTYETNFVDDLETKAFLLARWLDTG